MKTCESKDRRSGMGSGVTSSFVVLAACGVLALPTGCSGSESSSTVPEGGRSALGGATNASQGGKPSSAGGLGSGGTSALGGTNGAGGATNSSGGAQATGGASAGGTASSAGGTSSTGGMSSSGAQNNSGGATAAGGSKASGGTTANGGVAAGGRANGGGTAGGAAAGGASAGGASTGGTSATGGSGGASGGATSTGPCDIYAAANTPCAAAHSTTRALYGSYAGPLYQVRRASDKTTKDIPVSAPGGVANVSVQDSFCAGTTCTISLLYDQSPNKNDLVKSPKAYWLPDGGNEANAADAQITLAGRVVHGIYVRAGAKIGYRNNATKGIAKGDQAESMYMVVDAKRFNNQCCFDYGNAETTGNDDGNGTMEAVYFGSDITWGGTGEGNGPWVAADLENGVYKSDKGGWQSQSLHTASAKSIIANYATVMLKGPSGNRFALKAGDAQSSTLTTMWDGVRPANGYSPKKLQGAIILGTGGDGSPSATGIFFEGVMTSGNPPDSADNAVQANIAAAGYGH